MLKRVANPPNPWHGTQVEWLGEPPAAELEVYEEEARSILSENDSPDVPFRWSLNPYRGCFHACSYCYARPSHQYLDFGAGTDFDRKIVVKVNAPELLRRELARRRLREPLVLSGNTDCYQPLEAHYGLTRACLEVCREFRQPVSIITKGALVRRDAELLGELAGRAPAEVVLSIAFADPDDARLVEPHASSPARRFEALAELSARGVSTGVTVSPVIPGLNESQIPEVLRRAAGAGARRASLILLRLPREVEGIFVERLEQAAPLRAAKVISALRDARGGKLNASAFGERMRGIGPRWELIEDVFRLHCRRNGLECDGARVGAHPQTEAEPPEQGSLFGDL